MLFGSTMLEVAIGVIFVYLLVSLLCSALNELIEAYLQYRATNLANGIRRLLGNDELAQKLLDHPLVKPLGERPSYIPSRTFSLALWNLATTEGAAAALRKLKEGAPPPKEGEAAAAPQRTVADDVQSLAGAAGGVTQNVREIRTLIEGLPDEGFRNIKVSLLSLMDEAGNDMQKARENVEDWYDDAMDRVSGWYKRRSHKHLIYLGLVAAMLLNIDTINITKALLYNDTLRTSVADIAETYVKENPAPTPAAATITINTTPPAATPTASPAASPVASPAATASPVSSPSASPASSPTPEPPEERARRAREKIAQVRGELESLGLPIGWWIRAPTEPVRADFKDDKSFDEAKARYEKERVQYPSDPRRLPGDLMGWILKIVGLFITGLAVSQGAPFWFDLLNKFMVIRSTVKPKEKSPDEASKDKTTPRPKNDYEDAHDAHDKG